MDFSFQGAESSDEDTVRILEEAMQDVEQHTEIKHEKTNDRHDKFLNGDYIHVEKNNAVSEPAAQPTVDNHQNVGEKANADLVLAGNQATENSDVEQDKMADDGTTVHDSPGKSAGKRSADEVHDASGMDNVIDKVDHLDKRQRTGSEHSSDDPKIGKQVENEQKKFSSHNNAPDDSTKTAEVAEPEIEIIDDQSPGKSEEITGGDHLNRKFTSIMHITPAIAESQNTTVPPRKEEGTQFGPNAQIQMAGAWSNLSSVTPGEPCIPSGTVADPEVSGHGKSAGVDERVATTPPSVNQEPHPLAQDAPENEAPQDQENTEPGRMALQSMVRVYISH